MRYRTCGVAVFMHTGVICATLACVGAFASSLCFSRTPAGTGSVTATLNRINAILASDLGATSDTYLPIGFRYDPRDRKLWWMRLTPDRYCNGNDVTLAEAGARLSELDQDIVQSSENGQPELDVKCAAGGNCFEDWYLPVCMSLNEWLNKLPSLNRRKVFDLKKENANARLGKPFRTLVIDTTGDSIAAQAASDLLSNVIGRAGPPSSAYLAQAEQERQREKQQREEYQQRQEAIYSSVVGNWQATLPTTYVDTDHNDDGDCRIRTTGTVTYSISAANPQSSDYEGALDVSYDNYFTGMGCTVHGSDRDNPHEFVYKGKVRYVGSNPAVNEFGFEGFLISCDRDCRVERIGNRWNTKFNFDRTSGNIILFGEGAALVEDNNPLPYQLTFGR